MSGRSLSEPSQHPPWAAAGREGSIYHAGKHCQYSRLTSTPERPSQVPQHTHFAPSRGHPNTRSPGRYQGAVFTLPDRLSPSLRGRHVSLLPCLAPVPHTCRTPLRYGCSFAWLHYLVLLWLVCDNVSLASSVGIYHIITAIRWFTR